MPMASNNDPTPRSASEAAVSSSSSSYPVPDLLSIENPEEHFLKSKPLVYIVLQGKVFKFTDCQLNEQFFGHRFVSTEDLIRFMISIHKLLMCPEIVCNKASNIRDYAICKVAKTLVQVRPELKAQIEKALIAFYTEFSTKDPESLFDLVPLDKCKCCRFDSNCKRSQTNTT